MRWHGLSGALLFIAQRSALLKGPFCSRARRFLVARSSAAPSRLTPELLTVGRAVPGGAALKAGRLNSCSPFAGLPCVSLSS